MALVDNAFYVNFGDGSTTGYYALTKWATGTVIAAGAIRRQNAAPAVGSERVFVCIVAGTTHATTEPTWVITRGGKTTDNTVTWQECTGIAALNGDATNTPSWTITATPPGGVKNTAVTLGQVIKRDNGASYQICTTAGTAGNSTEPAFSDTAGTTKADNTVTWTSLGVVGNFTGWQAPHARIGNAFTSTWGQAGNTFYVGDNCAETQATAYTPTSPGTTALPCYIYCVNRAGSLPPVSADLRTTATVSTSGNVNLEVRGHHYCYGITFTAGNSTGGVALALASSGGGWQRYESCLMKVGSTNSGSSIQLGNFNANSPSRIELYNTPVNFSDVGQSFLIQAADFFWYNTASALAGTVPTSLFKTATLGACAVKARGVDFSAAGGGKTLIDAITGPLYFEFADCKLGASVTVAATPGNRASTRADLIRCDSAAANTRDERYWYEGTQTVDTTIVRTGGASDGTTPIAWKIVSTANSKWVAPFTSQPISIWNDTTGSSVTVTFYGIWGGGAVPNNDDIWIEAEYLGSSATPLGSFINSTKANNLATNSATTSDSSTWGGSTTKFKMAVTFTPQMKGPVNIVVKAAKVSSTFYIDPKPVLT